jgi:hypothetical protein
MHSLLQGLDRGLTEELGEEKAVALLEGDTLPAHIVRPAFFQPTGASHRKPTWSTCRRGRSEQGGRTW